MYKKLDVCFNEEKLEKITQDNYEYYKLVCNEEDFKTNYEKILNEFYYLLNRWKKLNNKMLFSFFKILYKHFNLKFNYEKNNWHKIFNKTDFFYNKDSYKRRYTLRDLKTIHINLLC